MAEGAPLAAAVAAGCVAACSPVGASAAAAAAAAAASWKGVDRAAGVRGREAPHLADVLTPPLHPLLPVVVGVAGAYRAGAVLDRDACGGWVLAGEGRLTRLVAAATALAIAVGCRLRPHPRVRRRVWSPA